MMTGMGRRWVLRAAPTTAQGRAQLLMVVVILVVMVNTMVMMVVMTDDCGSSNGPLVSGS